MRRILAAAALSAAALAFPTRAATLFVDHDAPSGGDGTSWAQAFTTISDAWLASEAGDEIWVAAGTYGPAGLADGLSLYGGFAGWETERSERDWVANVTTLQGAGGRVVTSYLAADAVLDGFTITGGNAYTAPGSSWGGGLLVVGGSVAIRNCTFSDNEAFLGGAIHAGNVASLVIEDCTFVSNIANGGGALWTDGGDEVVLERCVFRANVGQYAAGAANLTGVTAVVRDCVFAANSTTEVAGAVGSAETTVSYINCVFSRNSAGFHGAAMVVGAPGDGEILGCTFSDNTGSETINVEWFNTSAVVANSIIWGGSVPIIGPPLHTIVSSSCVQGGWPGSGNIDADPLFVQAGTDDVRLSAGSPCIDAGDNGAVPPGVTTDLAGAPRIQGAAVDLGAYEGSFEPMPLAAQADDLDPGEVALLVPSGGSPAGSAWIFVMNLTGEDNAIFTVAEPGDAHAGAGGYAETSSVLSASTTLADGAHFTQLAIPFDESDLGGADPFEMNATYFAHATGTWGLAVSRNMANSPGHPGPIGDRIVAEGPGGPQTTADLGDYGVHWDASAGTGVVWANVDHASDFGAGVTSCVEDCAQPPDERTGFRDLVAVLMSWGAGDGPSDVNGDGTVGAGDLTAVVIAWGLCPP